MLRLRTHVLRCLLCFFFCCCFWSLTVTLGHISQQFSLRMKRVSGRVTSCEWKRGRVSSADLVVSAWSSCLSVSRWLTNLFFHWDWRQQRGCTDLNVWGPPMLAYTHSCLDQSHTSSDLTQSDDVVPIYTGYNAWKYFSVLLSLIFPLFSPPSFRSKIKKKRLSAQQRRLSETVLAHTKVTWYTAEMAGLLEYMNRKPHNKNCKQKAFTPWPNPETFATATVQLNTNFVAELKTKLDFTGKPKLMQRWGWIDAPVGQDNACFQVATFGTNSGVFTLYSTGNGERQTHAWFVFLPMLQIRLCETFNRTNHEIR